jgi:hypothetical protein
MGEHFAKSNLDFLTKGLKFKMGQGCKWNHLRKLKIPAYIREDLTWQFRRG